MNRSVCALGKLLRSRVNERERETVRWKKRDSEYREFIILESESDEERLPLTLSYMGGTVRHLCMYVKIISSTV